MINMQRKILVLERGKVVWVVSNSRLNSSGLPLEGLCLFPKATTIGRPILSCPCIHTLLCDRSLAISDSGMCPFGRTVFFQARYLRKSVEAFSMSMSRARRNRLIIRSSTSCIHYKDVTTKLVSVSYYILLYAQESVFYFEFS